MLGWRANGPSCRHRRPVPSSASCIARPSLSSLVAAAKFGLTSAKCACTRTWYHVCKMPSGRLSPGSSFRLLHSNIMYFAYAPATTCTVLGASHSCVSHAFEILGGASAAAGDPAQASAVALCSGAWASPPHETRARAVRYHLDSRYSCGGARLSRKGCTRLAQTTLAA